MREGVCASRVALAAGPPTTVLDFLRQRLPRVTDWDERLASGEVLDAAGRPVGPREPCRHGAVLWYWRQPPAEVRVADEVVVLHQDEHLVAVDKPHGMPVTPGGRWLHETVLVRLRRQLGIDTLAPVHRLDLETAGVMLFTVPLDARHPYQRLFAERRVHKVYEALVPWHEALPQVLPLVARHRLQERPGEAFMQMEVLPGEPNTETRIELIARQGQHAHLRLRPLTGRKHQLRAQLAALGWPIVGDRIYPVLQPPREPDAPDDGQPPLQLLARELGFDDPLTGHPRRFESRRSLTMAPSARPTDPGKDTAATTAAPTRKLEGSDAANA
jgi:tRNA pseudouridine32 synthase/23S rRNA pseudouridine746 synthase